MGGEEFKGFANGGRVLVLRASHSIRTVHSIFRVYIHTL